MLLLFTKVLHFFSLQIFPILLMLLGIFCPYHFGAPVSYCSFKCFQLLIQGLDSFPFYIFGPFPCQFQFENCCLPSGTTALYLPILKLIFRRCSCQPLWVLFALKFDAISFTSTIIFLSFHNIPSLRSPAFHKMSSPYFRINGSFKNLYTGTFNSFPKEQAGLQSFSRGA